MGDLPQTPPEKTPQHVAIIMDGNGRWALSHGKPRLAGHRAGTENLRRIIRASVDFNVAYLTIYAFSTENWHRPPAEVQGLMHIMEDVIDRELDELNEEGVRLRHLGRLEKLGSKLRRKVQHAVDLTKNNTRLNLNIAFNYGGRDEIIYAVQNMIREGISADDVNIDMMSKYLFTAGIPDPDLIIRTSGELRTSNFLIWQSAYAEWYITPTYWPDFDRQEYAKAIETFAQRDRRYGGIAEKHYE